jgi:hypothetical protein
VSEPRPTEAAVERALRDLAASIAYPPTPDLAARVRARLAGVPSPPLDGTAVGAADGSSLRAPPASGHPAPGEGQGEDVAGREEAPAAVPGDDALTGRVPGAFRAERATRSQREGSHPAQPASGRGAAGGGRAGAGPRPWRLRPLARPALAAAAALAAAVLVLAGSPEARTAVADALGLRGVLIARVASVAVPVTATPDGSPARGEAGSASTPAPGEGAAGPARALRLGEPTTLEAARARLPFRPLGPDALGRPDELYFDSATAGGQLAFVYRPRAGLPPTSNPAVGALFTQFQAGLEPGFFAKGLGPDTRLELLTVNGGRAVWIEGSPHLFYYRDREGEIRDESVRLAGNVLLWEQEGLTLRLEANVPKDEAVRIAASAR